MGLLLSLPFTHVGERKLTCNLPSSGTKREFTSAAGWDSPVLLWHPYPDVYLLWNKLRRAAE